MHQVRIKGSEQVFSVGKIVCLGRNYLDHIRELGNPVPDRAVIFCKPASSIIADGGAIRIPDYSDDCHHELELAVLIGKTGKQISLEHALEHVAGYAVALDLTLRDILSNQVPLIMRREIYASACILGGFLLVILHKLEISANLSLVLAAGSVILLRLLAIHYNWALPKAE